MKIINFFNILKFPQLYYNGRKLQSFNFFFILFLFISFKLNCHEFWLEPLKYNLTDEDIISANIKVGENFIGTSMIYHDSEFEIFSIIDGPKKIKVKQRIGDIPALNFDTQLNGLISIIYESTHDYAYYKKFDKFLSFASDKGYNDIEDLHLSLNYPTNNFNEIYKRFAKSLVYKNSTKGKDQNTELLFEFILEENPYNIKNETDLNITLTFKDKIVPNHQINIWTKSQKGEVSKFNAFSNEIGKFQIPVLKEHEYLIDSVIIREVSDSEDLKKPLWESLWASLTFFVPK